MSEIKVPITVINPISNIIPPAKNISCATKALTSIGPTVGKDSTTPTMILPEIKYGSI